MINDKRQKSCMDGFKVLIITRMMNERGRLKVFQTTFVKVGFSTQPTIASPANKRERIS